MTEPRPIKAVWILFRQHIHEDPIVAGVYTSVKTCNEAEVKLRSALGVETHSFCFSERFYVDREPKAE